SWILLIPVISIENVSPACALSGIVKSNDIFPNCVIHKLLDPSFGFAVKLFTFTPLLTSLDALRNALCVLTPSTISYVATASDSAYSLFLDSFSFSFFSFVSSFTVSSLLSLCSSFSSVSVLSFLFSVTSFSSSSFSSFFSSATSSFFSSFSSSLLSFSTSSGSPLFFSGDLSSFFVSSSFSSCIVSSSSFSSISLLSSVNASTSSLSKSSNSTSATSSPSCISSAANTFNGVVNVDTNNINNIKTENVFSCLFIILLSPFYFISAFFLKCLPTSSPLKYSKS